MPAGSDTLYVGETLKNGEQLVSRNRLYALRMETGGNLVIWGYESANESVVAHLKWQTHTHKTGRNYLTMVPTRDGLALPKLHHEDGRLVHTRPNHPNDGIIYQRLVAHGDRITIQNNGVLVMGNARIGTSAAHTETHEEPSFQARHRIPVGPLAILH